MSFAYDNIPPKSLTEEFISFTVHESIVMSASVAHASIPAVLVDDDIIPMFCIWLSFTIVVAFAISIIPALKLSGFPFVPNTDIPSISVLPLACPTTPAL